MTSENHRSPSSNRDDDAVFLGDYEGGANEGEEAEDLRKEGGG